ncbi:S8 family serine peptidase [Lachnospiraceae bacterium ZAX-1]
MDRVNKIVNAQCAHERGYTGEGIGVAVMDTGIFKHPDFDHRISGFRDFIGGQSALYDDNGHGTHVARW